MLKGTASQDGEKLAKIRPHPPPGRHGSALPGLCVLLLILFELGLDFSTPGKRSTRAVRVGVSFFNVLVYLNCLNRVWLCRQRP